MTGEPGATGAPRPLAEEGAQGQDALGLEELQRAAMLAWVSENLTLVRRSASGQRILYWSLGICFVVGLAVHSARFLLRSSATTEPLMLVVDLLYALGWALWTGVVLVVFLEAYPEAKKRQYKRVLDAYRRRYAIGPEPEVVTPRARSARRTCGRASTSGPSTPTRLRIAIEPEPEVARPLTR